MKIIGMAGSDIIAQLTAGDLASLIGERYFDQVTCRQKLEELGLGNRDHSGFHIRIGSTIDLAGRFERIKSIEYRHSELRDVAKKLQAMADLLDHLGDQVIVPPADAT